MRKLPILFTVLFFSMTVPAQKKYNLLVGTYTHSCKSDGIYVYEFNAETAGFKRKSQSDKVGNPSYLTLSADKKKIYSVNENGKNSSVSAFGFDSQSGKISFLNKQSSEGADPCYIINDDKNVIVANYSGGNISVFGKNHDGSLTKAKQIINHEGKSVTERQQSPHVHQVHFSPDKNYVLANDLGTDRIYLYRYFPNETEEILQFKDSIPVKTGSGPRHLTFSPNGKFLYLLQELDGTLTVFSYENARLRRIQETTVVAGDFIGKTGAADIHISPDGKFLYATNRGDAHTISIFSIDLKGKLILRKTMSSGGKNPRNFAIDPSGNYVLAAHQDSNDIVIFRRDLTTGLLTETGKKIDLCAPVCLVFAEE